MTKVRVVHEFMSESPVERGLRYVRLNSDGTYTLAADATSEQLHSGSSGPFSLQLANLAFRLRYCGEPTVLFTSCPSCGVDVNFDAPKAEGSRNLQCTNCGTSFSFDPWTKFR